MSDMGKHKYAHTHTQEASLIEILSKKVIVSILSQFTLH